jgi:hypothetical protein
MMQHQTTVQENRTSKAQLSINPKPMALASPQTSVQQLQRALGNQATLRMLQAQSEDHDHGTTSVEVPETNQAVAPSSNFVKLPLRGFIHPVAASLNRPGVRFRLTTFDRLKAAYTDKDLKIPEAVIKARVTQLLERMKKESRLKSAESVATIVSKIFPGPGLIDEAEFNNAIDVADRSNIYKSVTDADTKVLAVDRPGLQLAMKKAADDIKTSEGDAAGLTQVFGSKAATAKTNYAAARKVLEDLSASAAKVAAVVTTDYNLDDPEVALGGWADFGSQKMHLLLEVAQVKDLAETKATVIHEAAHLSNASVDDHVYYSKTDPNFFGLDEAKKVNNAAHYEELPRRLSGTSDFPGMTFTPGVTPGGSPMTREDNIKAAAVNYLRKAWDAGVDVFTLIRGVRREYLAGNKTPFTTHKVLLLEISKLMDLTIHEQAAGKEIVTTLDVTLAESVSRGVALVQEEMKSVPFPSPIGALTDIELRDKIVAAAVVRYGNLLKDAAKDKALLDWLEAHYRSLPGV